MPETAERKGNNMDEKMKATIKGIYDNLSDDLKEKVKACKTMEEVMELAGKEGIELPDEVVDAVAGGVGACPTNCSGFLHVQAVP